MQTSCMALVRPAQRVRRAVALGVLIIIISLCSISAGTNTVLPRTQKGRKGNTLRSFATCEYTIQHFFQIVNLDFLRNCQIICLFYIENYINRLFAVLFAFITLFHRLLSISLHTSQRFFHGKTDLLLHSFQNCRLIQTIFQP